MKLGKKIDLHIHSTFSDGMKTPTELVAMYRADGYDQIAITDHDGVGGVPEAQAAGARAGLEVVAGIEIGSVVRDRNEIHLLGYDFDIYNDFLTKKLEEMRAYRIRRNERLLQIFQEKGYPLTHEDLIQRPEQHYIGKPNFAMAFERMGYVKSVQEAFQSKELLASPEARALRKMKVRTGDAIQWIHDAGGIAVVAHPMKIHGIGEKGSPGFFRELEDILRFLTEHGLDGLECGHPSASPAQAETLSRLADRYGLLKTRGSDYHGIDEGGR